MVRNGQWSDGGAEVEVVAGGRAAFDVVSVGRAACSLAQSVREIVATATTTDAVTDHRARRPDVRSFVPARW